MSSKDYFRPDIQGLRGVAVLLVVIYHTGFAFSGGFIGVDMFFVISGFVITQVLLREFESNGKVGLKDFYLRRARRLIPVLSVVIIITLLVSIVTLSPFGEQQQIIKTAVASIFFAGNIHLFAMNTYDALKGNPLRHLWSLGVEEQFYLIYPLVFVLICRFSKVSNLKKSLFGVFLFLATTSLFLSVSLSSGFEFGYREGRSLHQKLEFLTKIGFVAGGDWPMKFAFFGAPSRFWEILVGALIAVFSSSKKSLPRKISDAVTVTSALAILITGFLLTTEANFPGYFAMIPVFGTGLLIIFGEEKTPVNRVLCSRPIVWLGDISYSLYLWHWPMIVFSRAIWPGTTTVPIIAAGLSFGFAYSSYRKIETRFQLQEGPRQNLTWVILVLVVSVVLLSGVSKEIADSGLNIPIPESKWENFATRSGCGGGSELRGDDCFFVGQGRFLAILIGDSNARSASDGVVSAVHSLGGDLMISYESGCPFVDSHRIPDCRELNQFRFDSLVRLKPDLVVLVSNQVAYLKDLGEPEVITGFKGTLEFLNENGIPAVIQGNIPDCVFSLSLIKAWSKKIFECEIGLSKQSEWSRIVEISRLATLNYSDNEFVDPTQIVCPELDCRAKIGDEWIYSDMNHLSPTGSRMLTVMYERAIENILARKD